MKMTKRLLGSMLLVGTLVTPSLVFAQEVPTTEVTVEATTEETIPAVKLTEASKVEEKKTASKFFTRAAEAKEDTTVTVEDGVVLTVGDKVDLGVLVEGDNESIEFIVADTKVAKVDRMGVPKAFGQSVTKLTAVAEGETTVTIYTLDGQTLTCKVVVKAAEATEEAAKVEATTEAVEVVEAVKVEEVTEIVEAVEVVEAVKVEETKEEKKTASKFFTRAAEATENTTVMVEDGVVLTVGDKVDLGVLVEGDNESIEFIIADAKVAKVDRMGVPKAFGQSVTKLTAVAEGETTVTIYTLDGQTLTCKVIVKAAEAKEEVKVETTEK